jgi:hypothetical protein
MKVLVPPPSWLAEHDVILHHWTGRNGLRHFIVMSPCERPGPCRGCGSSPCETLGEIPAPVTVPVG